jgi:hypothetical protein
MECEMTIGNDLNPDDMVIWRYMDLPKFVATLVSKTLWFAKAALLEDRYEGFCHVLPREMPVHDPFAKCVTRTTGGGQTAVISVTQALVEMSKNSAAYFENARDHLYVNSWCMGTESMAMWQIYGSNSCGIAVRSSIGPPGLSYGRSSTLSIRLRMRTPLNQMWP